MEKHDPTETHFNNLHRLNANTMRTFIHKKQVWLHQSTKVDARVKKKLPETKREVFPDNKISFHPEDTEILNVYLPND